MALISSIDGETRKIYLSPDTVNSSWNPIDLYKEMRELRRVDENLRKYNLFMEASGNVPKGSGKFTERLVTLLEGTRIVPYNTSHITTVIGQVITDDGQGGVACFDRGPLSPSVVVDINYVPPQVEVIQVSSSGSGGDGGFSSSDRNLLERISKTLLNRTRINPSTNELEVYNDDGVTIAFKFDLTDDNGNPSSSSVFERVPQ